MNIQEVDFQTSIPECFRKQAAEYADLFIGRVILQHKGLYRILTEQGECFAEVCGKFFSLDQDTSHFPVVGDYVLVDRKEDTNGNAIIQHVLDRRSVLSRKMVGKDDLAQCIASNIDIVFLCMAMNEDFSVRRLERYIAIAWDSGATPVVVLTKKDLATDVATQLEEVYTVAIGMDVVLTTNTNEDGHKEIEKYLCKGTTVAFVGSSGVGKSTLINKLLGEAYLDTQGLRSGGQGKHTTTHRELVYLQNGSAVIDTPGMREIGLQMTDVSRAFPDIEEYSLQCKFNDCTHTNEPGCAVRKAIEDGILSEERLNDYLKLQKESKYSLLDAKQIEKKKMQEMFSSFDGIKNAKKYLKTKDKRKFDK